MVTVNDTERQLMAFVIINQKSLFHLPVIATQLTIGWVINAKMIACLRIDP